MQKMNWASWTKKTALAVSFCSLLFAACSDDKVDFVPGENGNTNPPPEDTILLDGLTDAVTVKIDEEGIPHIQCKTAVDCTAALGYMHARDRFFQLEVRRDFVRGKLHTIISPALVNFVVDTDVGNRTKFLTRDGRPIEEVALEYADDETLAMLEAYSVGVNHYIAEMRESKDAMPWEFFAEALGLPALNTDGIQDWTPEDSLASVVALVDSLTNSSSSELNNGLRQLAFASDPDVYHDLVVDRPVSPATSLMKGYDHRSDMPNGRVRVKERPQVVPPSVNIAPYQNAIEKALAPHKIIDRLLGTYGEVGSNNWAVNGSHSKSGNALLSNDPHLGHTNPATWYIAEMEATDGSMHVSGVSFAGLPWVILGQNEHLAWGATTTYFDQSDVFLLELNEDKTQDVTSDTPIDLLTFDATFEVNGKSKGSIAKIHPEFGPIIGEHNGYAVALRWTGAELSTDVNVLTKLMRAKTVAEGREAMKNVTTLGQNWVMIDTAGNHGWFPYNHVPIRNDADGNLSYVNPALPLPGDGSVVWDGYIPLQDLPQFYNNDDGFVATANNDMTGQLWDGDATNDGIPIFQTGVADGLREERIQNLLKATDAHTTDTMIDIVGDSYMLMRDYVVPQIQTLLADETEFDDLKARIDALADWDGTCPTGLKTSDPAGPASDNADERAAAVQCTIFHRFLYDLRVHIFQDELRAVSTSAPLASYGALADLLSNNAENRLINTDYWDDVATTDVVETPADIIQRAMDATLAAIPELEGLQGETNEDAWLWGRVHRVTLTNEVFPQFGIEDFNNGPYALPGGFSTVNVAGPSQSPDKGFDTGHGASMRLVCEGLPQGMSCSIQLPGGQVDDPESPYYDSFLERWLTNTPTALTMGADIENPVDTLFFGKKN